MENSYQIAVGLLLLFVVLWIVFKKKSNNQSENNNLSSSFEDFNIYFSENTPDIVKKISNKFAEKFDFIIKNYDLKISISQALASLRIESGNYIDIPNSQIIGDNGKSIGRMQIYFYNNNDSYALQDIAKYRGIILDKDDMFDEYKNLLAGCLYLDIAMTQALQQGSSNAIKTAYKKYNGGLDETELSVNTQASNYANTAYNYYREFEKYLTYL
jgi:hypothetical protein